MKKCLTCKNVKPLGEFHVRSKSPDGRQANCKDCNKAQRAAYFRTEKGRENNRESGKKTLLRNRQNLFEYLREHPCVTCGESDIVVLEFDHRDRSQKNYDIARMIAVHSWERIVQEIEKCDVLCANCHRRRTASQFGWAKATHNVSSMR